MIEIVKISLTNKERINLEYQCEFSYNDALFTIRSFVNTDLNFVTVHSHGFSKEGNKQYHLTRDDKKKIAKLVLRSKEIAIKNIFEPLEIVVE